MNIAGQSAKRPIAIFMLLFAIVVFGIIALQKLHLELLPQMEYPYAAVFATYMGASSEEVEQLVTNPLEEIIATVPGVKNFTSVSQSGLSLIIIEYNWGVDVLSASSRLERYLNISQLNLPEQVKPIVVEFDPSLLPVFVFSTSQDPAHFLDEIKRLPDVASVENLSKTEKFVSIRIDPEKARSFQVDLSLIEYFLSGNVVYPMGQVEDETGNVYSLVVDGRFNGLDELKDTIVGFRGLSYQSLMRGQLPKLLVPVRLKQIADVEIANEPKRGLVRVDGNEATVVSIRKRSGANTVNVVRQVKRLLDDLEVDYVPLIDQSFYTEKSVQNLVKNLILGLLGASIVVALFVRDFFSTTIVALSIPISLLIAVVLMYFFGINLDLITLGGLAMAVGMLVDNAIVVFENIYRHKSEGSTYDIAAIDGTKEVFGAIFASTATTVVVFAPLVFTESFASTLFKYFASTFALSLAASLVVAGILIPAGSRWIRARESKTFLNIRSKYQVILTKILERKALIIPIVFALIVLSVFYVFHRPKNFLPDFATNTLTITAKAENQSGYRKTYELTKQIEDFVLSRKNYYGIKTIYSEVGATSELSRIITESGENQATIYIWFDGTRSEYLRNKEMFLRDLKKTSFEGLEVRVVQDEYLNMIFGYPVTVELTGEDIDELMKVAFSLKEIFSEKDLGEVSIRGQANVESLLLKIDRSKAVFSGLLPAQIFMDLQYYTMGKNFNTLRTNEGILPVRLNISDIQQLHDIDEIQIKNLRDQNLPLRLLGELSKRTTYESISHKNGQRVVYVDIADTRYSISQLSSLVENVLKDLQLKDVHYSLGGQKSSLDIFLNEFKVIMLVAIILVYMLLSAQFESLLSPFVIFTTVPVSVIALALVMIVFDYDLNLSVMIGTLTLAGVVVNNAIVMVTFLHQKITTGNYKQIRCVIVESASLRLRPILMTTLTTVIALIPVAISNAEGSEFESPIAWTIIFGLLITTMFTLLVLPAIAEIFEKRRFRPH